VLESVLVLCCAKEDEGVSSWSGLPQSVDHIIILFWSFHLIKQIQQKFFYIFFLNISIFFFILFASFNISFFFIFSIYYYFIDDLIK
jgi:hypothetical protein